MQVGRVMTIKPFLNLLAIVLPTAVFSAHAAIIDFESLAHDGSVLNVDSPYLEDGFIIQDPSVTTTDNNAFGVLGSIDDRYTGSAALFNRSLEAVTMLSRQDGAAFNLFSIDLAELTGDVNPPDILTVTFEGFLASGGTVLQTFQLDGIAFGLETFTFTGFEGISEVRWAQGPAFLTHQFDNIVTAIPVPAAVWLFGSGLLGLTGVARYRR